MRKPEGALRVFYAGLEVFVGSCVPRSEGLVECDYAKQPLKPAGAAARAQEFPFAAEARTGF